MSDKYIHIVSFDIPYPADYGGVIDVFYKVKALSEQGVKIILHCFEYGRNRNDIFNNYVEKIYYYPRILNKRNLFSFLPYIVATRESDSLINNLLKDEFPILFEGLHCCFYLNDDRLKNRIKVARTHNIEHDYYSNLAVVEKKWQKKLYFKIESAKLKFFESNLSKASIIAAISKNDTIYFSSKYSNCIHVSAFHPHENIDIKTGIGKYALYHGNLGVGENNQAALFIVNSIFKWIDYPLIIAGNKASEELIEAVKNFQNITILQNVDNDYINELIENAQINILPTFQSTGIKLKLLAALYKGRHCLVNSPMVVNTGLESLCEIADDAELMKKKIIELSKIEFTESMMAKRKKLLINDFSNTTSVKKLIETIWPQ